MRSVQSRLLNIGRGKAGIFATLYPQQQMLHQVPYLQLYFAVYHLEQMGP